MWLIFCLLFLLPIISTDAGSVQGRYTTTRMNTADDTVSWIGRDMIKRYNDANNKNFDLKGVTGAIKNEFWWGLGLGNDVLLETNYVFLLEVVNHVPSCSVHEYVAFLKKTQSSTILLFFNLSSSPDTATKYWLPLLKNS